MDISQHLKNWMDITSVDATVFDYIEGRLKEYQDNNNNDYANKFSLYKVLYEAHLDYVKVFNLLKMGGYYEAWCLLERIEINLITVKDNAHYLDSVEEYGVRFLKNMVRNWQSLYPYKVFISSREIIKEIRCSVCNEKRHFINDCGHVKGRLYNGVLCVDMITDFEPITYDVVSNPVNKFSVLFSEKGDNYDYSIIEYVLNYMITEHQIFFVVKWYDVFKKHDGISSPSYLCPCNSSFKNYEECCLERRYICTPHIHIDFPMPLDI